MDSPRVQVSTAAWDSIGPYTVTEVEQPMNFVALVEHVVSRS